MDGSHAGDVLRETFVAVVTAEVASDVVAGAKSRIVRCTISDRRLETKEGKYIGTEQRGSQC